VEVVASLSQCRTAAAQCGLFTHKSVPVIFEPPCIIVVLLGVMLLLNKVSGNVLVAFISVLSYLLPF